MFVSAEILTTVIGFAAFLVTLGGGFGWLIRRSDAQLRTLTDQIGSMEQRLTTRIDTVEERLSTRIDTVEERLNARIDTVEERLSSRIDSMEARIDSVEDRLGARIDAQTRELTEVKIAIARIEGPRPHLIPVR